MDLSLTVTPVILREKELQNVLSVLRVTLALFPLWKPQKDGAIDKGLKPSTIFPVGGVARLNPKPMTCNDITVTYPWL